MENVISQNLQHAIHEFSVNANPDALISHVKDLDYLENNPYMGLLLLRMLANKDPDVLSLLGDRYYQGIGVLQDKNKSVCFFQEAAKQGSVRANYDLGWLYYDQKKYKHAIEYFLICEKRLSEFPSTQQGKILHCLGYAYCNLSDPDYQRAITFLLEAGDKFGNKLSYRQLGCIYSTANQIENFEKSLQFYSKAANLGDMYSVHKVASAYIFGIDGKLDRDLDKAEQILLPHRNCDDWEVLTDLAILYKKREQWVQATATFEKAWAIQEEPFVAGELGYQYYRDNQFSKAEKLLRYADEHGNYSYSDFLGRMYLSGDLGSQNPMIASNFYCHAYDNGMLNNVFTYVEYVELLCELGQYNKAFEVADKGEEVYNDIEFVYQKAKLVLNGYVRDQISMELAEDMMLSSIGYDIHNTEACIILGNYYKTIYEYRNAEKYYLDAFSAGEAEAAVYLGRLYECGGGSIRADIAKAVEWFQKAANAGSRVGQKELQCFRKGILGGYRRTSAYSDAQ